MIYYRWHTNFFNYGLVILHITKEVLYLHGRSKKCFPNTVWYDLHLSITVAYGKLAENRKRSAEVKVLIELTRADYNAIANSLLTLGSFLDTS